jgi:diadenylate cyclase
MPEGLLHLFARRPIGQIAIDVVDLLIVAYVVYRALLVLRGTRAMQMGLGLGLIFLVYLAAKWLELTTLQNLFQILLSSIILIVVVVFQNDIRRGLMRVGSRAVLGGFARTQESKVIDEVVAAATELARHRMGALIAFEQDANLDEFVVAQGVSVESLVTRELLVSMFVPESVNKLHDGAVVIRNLRIAKAGVFFPMPESRVVDTSLGSRHRAALGITEETDAVVIVVSEERGTISFCFSGNIVSNLDGASLRQALLGLFGRKARKKGKKIATPAGRVSVPSTPAVSGRPAGTPLPEPAANAGAAEAAAPAGPRGASATAAAFAVGSHRAPLPTPLAAALVPPIAQSPPPPPVVPGSGPPLSAPPGFPGEGPLPDTMLPFGISLSEPPSAPSVTSMRPPPNAAGTSGSDLETAGALSPELPQSPIERRNVASPEDGDE